MDASEALTLLRESAAQITTEEAQETINAAAQANPNKRAFTEITWNWRPDPSDPYGLPPTREPLFPTKPNGGADLEKMKERGLKARAKLAKAAKDGSSPLFSCCVVGNCPEPLCSG